MVVAVALKQTTVSIIKQARTIIAWLAVAAAVAAASAVVPKASVPVAPAVAAAVVAPVVALTMTIQIFVRQVLMAAMAVKMLMEVGLPGVQAMNWTTLMMQKIIMISKVHRIVMMDGEMVMKTNGENLVAMVAA